MDVPNLFQHSEQKGQERLLLSLLLTNSSIQAALWSISGDVIEVLRHSKPFTYKDQQSCLLSTDKALQELGKQSENVNETVFGFEASWVDDAGITDAKKPLLKKVTEELSLQPVGFVVMTEALYHHFLKKDPQLSTLLVQLLPDDLVVSVVDRGSLVKSEQVGRSKAVVSDVTEALARFQEYSVEAGAHFPSAMTIVGLGVDQDEVREQQQVLLGHDWTTTHAFLQTPTIDVVDEQTALAAVVTEGGKALATGGGLPTPGSTEAPGLDEDEPKSSEEDDIDSDANEVALAPEVLAHSAGVAAHQHDADEQAQKESSSDQKASKSSKGFFKTFMSKIPGFKKTHTTAKTAVAHDRDTHADHDSDSALKHWIATHMPFVIGGFGAGLLVLVAVGVAATILTRKALVEISLVGVPVSKEVEIVLDPDASESSPTEQVLKADVVSDTVSGTKTVETTGVTLVGEPATGGVTIFNKTDSEKTFAAGTRLSSGQLAFTLDEEVTIASASVSQSSGSETRTYGSAEAQITATAIGAEGNLADETEMTVADFSDTTYSATITEGLSGGASREVRVVSQDDRDTVLAELKQELVDEAVEQLQASAGDGKYIVPSGITEVESASFDAEVGDEVRTLELNLSLLVQAVSYNNEDLQPLAEHVLSSEVPSNHQLSTQPPSILSQPTESASDSAQITLTANVSSTAIPTIFTDTWVQEIAGLSPDSAAAVLRGKGEVRDVTIVLSPFPARFIANTIPSSPQAVTFMFVGQE